MRESVRVHQRVIDAERQPRERGAGREAVIVVDTMGGGKPIFDELRSEGWPVVPYFSNGAPTYPRYAEDWDALTAYANARAQAYGNLAALLREGRVALPRDPDLAADLLAHHRLWTTKGTLAIESKPDLRARLGRSPDLGDAIAMCLGTDAADAITVGGAEVTF